MSDLEPPDANELDDSLRAFTWFLDRAADGGIPRTAAGYLRPADVAAVARVLPTMGGWIGKANRESETAPVLLFRNALQSLGLLRKHKGALRLTRPGASAQQAREELWNRLADKLVPGVGGFEVDAALLLLAYAATSAGSEIPLDDVAAALTTIGWRADGHPIERRDIYRIPALEVLRNVTTAPTTCADRWRISPSAAKLARAALQNKMIRRDVPGDGFRPWRSSDSRRLRTVHGRPESVNAPSRNYVCGGSAAGLDATLAGWPSRSIRSGR